MGDRHVLLVASRYRDGGVERWMNRLAKGLVGRGIDCGFLLGERQQLGAAGSIPEGATIHQVPTGIGLGQALQQYLQQTSGEVAVLAFRTADYSDVIRAVRRHGGRARVYLTTGAFVSERLDPKAVGRFRAWKDRRRLHHDWLRADGVIAVSSGVARDWLSSGPFQPERVHAPPPPVAGSDVTALSCEELEHPWALPGEPPLFVGVGRLVQNKGFDQLITAFADLRARRACRLVVLGKGPEEARLRAHARELGVDDEVAFPGFSVNPYQWMRHARALVMTSNTEPFGFVLIESLYVGTPFIAMDGPPGPRQIHMDTQAGTLVPQGDVRAMSRAMEYLLNAPPEPDKHSTAAAPYEISSSVDSYLRILFPGAGR